MVRRNWVAGGYWLVICLVLLSGCRQAAANLTEPTLERPKASTQEPMRCGAACLLEFKIFVWEDIDRDGQCDEPEPPAVGIQVSLDHAYGVVIPRTSQPVVTDYSGTALLELYSACPCGEQRGATLAERMAEISPEFVITPPAGCLVIMPERQARSSYQFGLACSRPASPPPISPPPTQIPVLPQAANSSMPEYYRPDPGLIRVSDPSWTPNRVRWIDNSHFEIAEWVYHGPVSSCKGEVWAIDVASRLPVLQQTDISSQAACDWPTSPTVDIAWFEEQFGEDNPPGIQVSPDSKKALAFAWIELSGAPPPDVETGGIQLGDDITDFTYYEQGWLLELATRRATPLYTSREFFVLQWIDNDHLVGIGSCYGMTSDGLFILDTRTSALYEMNDYSTVCEGDPGIKIAPDTRHLTYAGFVYSITGEQKAHICESGYARNAAWSQDGRYAYAACSSDGSDTLRRYDTRTGQVVSLTDPDKQTFRAIEFYPSPDQAHMLIVWGNSRLFNQEPFGVWLLDLSEFKR
jgi:hypothetical protein